MILVGFPNIANLDLSKYFLFWMASLIHKIDVNISTHQQEGVKQLPTSEIWNSTKTKIVCLCVPTVCFY